MRQPESFSHEDGYRSSSPTSQLPSLHQQLLRHRQDERDGSNRPKPREEASWTVNQPTGEQHVSASLELAPPSEPSPSWSDASSTLSDPSPRGSEPDTKRKRPRFLGDIDRRLIIQRLENGEKQADLAREFGVTRAAICHINKNRDEILTRFDILAKSPQGRQMIENYVQSPHVSSLVRELRTANVSVLLTRLRNNNTSLAVFKSTADRLMSILLEEALVSFGTKPIGVQDLLGSSYDGKEYTRPTFALSYGGEGRPFLNMFASMEPAGSWGYIAFDQLGSGVNLRQLDLPANAEEANVLVCLNRLHDADAMRSVLRVLADHGVTASRVCIVCISATESALSAVAKDHPNVKIVTAELSTGDSDPSLDGFVRRWRQAVEASGSLSH